MNIRAVRVEDAFEIKDIYNYYILNSVVTFEESPVSVEEIKSRIQSIIINFPWIVYEVDNQILGYAYANNWKLRAAYKQSVESSVYLKPGELNKGVGSKLYKALIKLLVKKKYMLLLEEFHYLILRVSPYMKSLVLKKLLILRRLDLNLKNGLMLVIGN